MQKIINKLIHLFLSDEKILELKNRHSVPSVEWSLRNLKKLGFDPKFAIDVGAFNGEWTKMFKNIFPSSKVLMMEAQQKNEPLLNTAAKTLTGTDYYIGLLGAQPGKEVTFNLSETVSSVLEEYKPNFFEKEVRMLETLDDIVTKKMTMFANPDFIKLDVQGYELEVLKGATESLKGVQIILCEVSLLEINKDCPLITDVIRFMDDKDFIPYDICSFIRRPLDKALWQTDIVFIKKNHPLIRNKYWN